MVAKQLQSDDVCVNCLFCNHCTPDVECDYCRTAIMLQSKYVQSDDSAWYSRDVSKQDWWMLK